MIRQEENMRTSSLSPVRRAFGRCTPQHGTGRRRRPWLVMQLLAGFMLLLVVPAPASTTITRDLTITPQDTKYYDGLDLIISGAKVTVSGHHAFNSLILTNGATLTCPPAPWGEQQPYRP